MINLRRLTYFLILLVLGGCAESLKSAWGDFTAYYNTYYNARNYLESGIRKTEAIEMPVGLHHMIRIFPTPPDAAPSDFQAALEKGAKVIREHPASHWSDDALALIGKAYFYQGHYYNAAKAFNDLYGSTGSEKLRQEAVFWLGRVYMETRRYETGIQFLNGKLVTDSLHWLPQNRRYATLLLADTYVAYGNPNAAYALIRNTIPNLERHDLKARASYLAGQILEATGKYVPAYRYYALAFGLRPSFELLFASRLKMAVTSREMGRYGQSMTILNHMLTDDKNIDRLSVITYEKAVTLRQIKQYVKAREALESVLHNPGFNASRSLKAQAYYQIGEIYREHYKDFMAADVFYDSASAINVKTTDLPSQIDISGRSRTFRTYASLRKDIGKIDSLLWLGSLSVNQADSILKIQHRQRRNQLLKARNQEKNTMLNVQGIQNKADSTKTGFLNIRDPILENEAKAAFRTIWGNRPLVDNWRRSASIQMDNMNAGSGNTVNKPIVKNRNQISAGVPTLAGIPFTEPQKEKLRMEKLNKQYELANVFFLEMGMPDSAAYYYNVIIHQRLDTLLIPKAIYSLIRLYQNKGAVSQASGWEDTLRNRYPNSTYSRRLTVNGDNHVGLANQKQDTLQSEFARFAAAYADSDHYRAARAAEQWARRNNAAPAGAEALYFTAEQYILAAKNDTSGHCSGKSASELQVPADSAKYKGPCWDKARVTLQGLIEGYPQWSGRDKARLLLQALEGDNKP